METYIANINNALQAGPKPSIFEIYAAESLDSSLSPAISYLLKVLSSKAGHLQLFRTLYKYSDEICVLLKSAFEAHFIWEREATFAEHFYGLTRAQDTAVLHDSGNKRSSTNAGSSRNLKLSGKLASLLSVALAPYLGNKLETLIQNANEPESGKNARRIAQICSFLYHVMQTLNFVYYLLYIIGLVRVHSPMFAILRLQLRYFSSMNSKVPESEVVEHPWMSLSSVLSKVKGIFVFLLESGLPVGVFFLKFLQWWYEERSSADVQAFNSLPTPPPPSFQVIGDSSLLHGSLCPLCRKVHVNPTVIRASGYVFCYKCIFLYIEKNMNCPVTKIPCSCDDLVRIYSD